MQRSSRKAWLALCALLCGCSLVTDFDPDKVTAAQNDGQVAGDAGPGNGSDAGPAVGMDAQVRPDSGGMDSGPIVEVDGGVLDTGPGVECTSNAQCSADQLCCNSMCVATSHTACSSCEERCSNTAANACNARVCGCGAAAACGDARPFCVGSGVASSCAQCRDATDCSGRTDGRSQCIQSSCAACDPMDNSGCGGTTPICSATTLSCVACSEAPNKCPGTTVCAPNGACGGCGSNDAVDCPTPTAPICNLTANPTVCRGCASNAECTTERGQPYCVANQRCSPCSPTGDMGCVATSTTPDCRLTAGQYQCQGCTQSSCPPGGTGPRNTCDAATGKCVECQTSRECTLRDPLKPFCDATDGLCKGCGVASSTFCIVNTLTVAPYCDASGACIRCRTSADCNAAGAAPICDATTHTCRACTVAAATDPDCAATPATPACSATSGRCVACRTGGPSACTTGPNQSCSATNTCVDCNAAGGCTAPQVCNTTTNMCVGCLVNADCNDMNVCTTDTCVGNACNHVAVPVADLYDCTTDTCAPVGGVSHTPSDPFCAPMTTDPCNPMRCLAASGGATPSGCGPAPVSCDAGVCSPDSGTCM